MVKSPGHSYSPWFAAVTLWWGRRTGQEAVRWAGQDDQSPRPASHLALVCGKQTPDNSSFPPTPAIVLCTVCRCRHVSCWGGSPPCDHEHDTNIRASHFPAATSLCVRLSATKRMAHSLFSRNQVQTTEKRNWPVRTLHNHMFSISLSVYLQVNCLCFHRLRTWKRNQRVCWHQRWLSHDWYNANNAITGHLHYTQYNTIILTWLQFSDTAIKKGRKCLKPHLYMFVCVVRLCLCTKLTWEPAPQVRVSGKTSPASEVLHVSLWLKDKHK